MAYRQGNREQLMLFPMSIEEMVPKDDPARVYDAFVDNLDFEKLDFKMNFSKVGNPEYDPKSMLKVLLYGYSYGLKSSRQIERAVYHNVIFIWLAGGLKPDHITIARFRKRNKTLLKQIFKECAQLCIKLNLIAGNVLFVDGSKIRANAGIKNSCKLKEGRQLLANIGHRINVLLNACEKADRQEEGLGSYVKLQEELNTLEKIQNKVKQVMAQMEAEGETEINTTDPDCRRMHGRQGVHSAYNAQIVVDEKHGLIVSNDVVNEANDRHQFCNQINQAQNILGKKCQVACADAGYENIEIAKKVADQGIAVVMPNQKQAAHKKGNMEFSKELFRYDPQQNIYICPQGQPLRYSHFNKETNQYLYRMKNAGDCHNCVNFGVCTTSRRGRSIIRLKEEGLKEKLAIAFHSQVAQKIYKRRKETVELVFGHIKHNLRFTSFSLRGIANVRAEMAILATVFNIRRLITLMGTSNLCAALQICQKRIPSAAKSRFLLFQRVFFPAFQPLTSIC